MFAPNNISLCTTFVHSSFTILKPSPVIYDMLMCVVCCSLDVARIPVAIMTSESQVIIECHVFSDTLILYLNTPIFWSCDKSFRNYVPMCESGSSFVVFL